jgi:hypothetical protein
MYPGYVLRWVYVDKDSVEEAGGVQVPASAGGFGTPCAGGAYILRIPLDLSKQRTYSNAADKNFDILVRV